MPNVIRNTGKKTSGECRLLRVYLFTAAAAACIGILCRMFSIGDDPTTMCNGLLAVAVVYALAGLLEQLVRSRDQNENQSAETPLQTSCEESERPHLKRCQY